MWIHIPKECFPYAPATEDLSLPSEWQELPPDLSLTSKGKPILLRTLRLLWNKGSYLRLLCGMTWPRSRAAVGVAWWKSSLRAFPANPSPPQESTSTSKTSDGSGPTLSGFYATWSPEQSFWRTSQGSLFEDWDQCLERFPNWGSMRSGRLYVRATQVSAHHTSEPECSSSQLNQSTDTRLWPTPSARDHRSTCASEKTHERNARPLSEVVGLHCQKTMTPGETGLMPVVLNPEFVETLQGLPTGWSAAACSETESSRSKPPTLLDSSGRG